MSMCCMNTSCTHHSYCLSFGQTWIFSEGLHGPDYVLSPICIVCLHKFLSNLESIIIEKKVHQYIEKHVYHECWSCNLESDSGQTNKPSDLTYQAEKKPPKSWSKPHFCDQGIRCFLGKTDLTRALYDALFSSSKILQAPGHVMKS